MAGRKTQTLTDSGEKNEHFTLKLIQSDGDICVFVTDRFILASREYLTGWVLFNRTANEDQRQAGRQAGSPVLRGHPHV